MLSVGRYQLLETLGEGGMGVVYKAFDPLLQRTVAVKLISARLQDAPDLRQRFFAEARAAGQLSHRNIVTIFDLGEDHGHPYFAMEFLEGRNLRARMQSPELMSLDRKLEVMTQVCEGLAYAHSKGITHRDIKPANIFITDAGDVKVLDFGLARLPASELTHSKTLIGTLNYMTPEQINGEKTDARTDIFAVGVVFYELLTSRMPFESDSVAALLRQILHDAPRPLSALQLGIPPQLAAIVERAMAKAREERYQSLSDLLVDLAECRAQLRGSDPGSGSRPAPPPPFDSGIGEGLTIPPHNAGGSAGRAASAARGSEPGSGPCPQAGAPGVPRSGAVRSTGMATGSGLGAGSWGGSGAASTRRFVLVAASSLIVGLIGVGSLSWKPFSTSEHRSARSEASAPLSASRTGRALATDDAATTVGSTGRREPGARGSEPSSPPPARAPASAGERGQPRTSAAAGTGNAERPGRQEANAALAALRAAKVSADEVDAASLVPDAYRDASRAGDDAEQLIRRSEFSLATVKLYEASGLFRRAEIEARTEQVRRAEQATAAEQARLAEQRRRAEETRAQQQAPTPPARVPHAAASPLAIPPEPGAAPPSASAPAAGHPAVEAGANRASAEAGVREVLARYVAALESRNLAALKRVWPGLSGAQEAAIRAEFENARRIAARLLDPAIEVSAGTATVTCRRRYEIETLDGHRLRSDTISTLSLRSSGGGWVVENVRHDVER